MIGLGRNPDDVNIGGLTVDAQWFGGNATQNFWRSAENFMVPGSARWAVAQAPPMRRVDIRGDNVNPAIHADRGFEVPVNAGVRFHDLLTVSLGGTGTIDHVINNTGAAAQGTATIPVDIVSFP